jgi:hypothetical protein
MSKTSSWTPLQRKGRAIYAFAPQQGAKGKGQITLNANDEVVVTGENKGWYRGYLAGKQSAVGIFPANYIELFEDTTVHKRRSTVAEEDKAELSARKKDILLEDIAASIKVWSKKARNFLRDGPESVDAPDSLDSTTYYQTKARIGMLLHWRGILLSPSSSVEEEEEAKANVFKMLEANRRAQAGFLVPRFVHGENISDYGLVAMFEMHDAMHEDLVEGNNVPERFLISGTGDQQSMLTKLMLDGPLSATSSGPKRALVGESLKETQASSELRQDYLVNSKDAVVRALHVYLEYKSSPCPVGDAFQIYFSLFVRNASNPNIAKRGIEVEKVFSAPRTTYLGETAMQMDGRSHAEGGRYISEEFVVNVTNTGLPHLEVYDQLKTLFSNVQLQDLEDGLYLVCKVYRIGGLEAPKKGQKSLGGSSSADRMTRRPYGVGVIDLSQCIHKIVQPTCDSMNVVVLRPKSAELLESNFSGLPMMIINSTPSGTSTTSKSTLPKWAEDGGYVTLRLFAAFDDLRTLTGNQPENSLIPALDVPGTPHLFFPPKIDPRESRDDLYVTLIEGSFSKEKKSQFKNVEVRVFAVLDTGAESKQLIRGVGPLTKLAGEYRSTVFYHNGKPQFGETFRVNTPETEVYRTHLLFIYYHVSTNRQTADAFGFSFLPLTDKNFGTMLDDGMRELDVYKPVGKMGRKTEMPVYLNWGQAALQKNKRVDSLKISTRLCSSTKSNLKWLHELLRWREKNLQGVKLVQVLQNIDVNKVDELHARYFRAIMDVLVDMIQHSVDDKVVNECFNVLVPVLSFLPCDSDHREHTLDIYLTHVLRTSSASLHVRLVQNMSNLLDWLSLVGDNMKNWKNVDNKNFTVAQKLMPAFPYITKLIITAAFKTAEQEVATATKVLLDFKKSLLQLLVLLNRIMSSELRFLRDFHRQIFLCFPKLFEALTKIYQYSELGEILRNLFECILSREKESSSMHCIKLQCLHAIICGRSKYIRHSEFRSRVLPCIVVTLRKHIISRDELEQTWSIMICKELVKVIHESKDTNDAWSISYVLPSMLTLLKTMLGSEKHAIRYQPSAHLKHIKPLKTMNIVGLTAASMLQIVEMMSKGQMKHFLTACLSSDPEIPSSEVDIYNFIKDLLGVCIHLISLEDKIFPELWAAVCILLHKNTLGVLTWFSSPLKSKFLFKDEDMTLRNNEYETDATFSVARRGSKFGRRRGISNAVTYLSRDTSVSDEMKFKLWFMFLSLGLDMLNSNTLDFEHSSQLRREYIVEQIGDMRDDVCDVIQSVWNALGKLKLSMIESLVEPLLRLADLQHEKTRALSTDMYFSLFRDEFIHTKSLSRVRFATINSVDIIVTERSTRHGMASGSNMSEGIRRSSLHAQSAVAKATSRHTPGQGFQELFSTRLMGKVKKDAGLCCPETINFFNNVMELFELLSVISKFGGVSDLKYEDEQTQAMLHLMEYLKKSERDDMYSKYVRRLHRMHLDLGNHDEAGAVLLMHASYPWAANMLLPAFQLSASEEWPSESLERRQVRVYREVIDVFAAGKNWEKCLQYCEELRKFYERHFHFVEVATTLREQAGYFEMIYEKQRFFPTHFRVAFLGKAYEEDNRNKIFVYRGGPLESIMEFSSRMREKFPSAKMVPPGKESLDMKEQEETLYMQISTLTAAFDEEWDLQQPEWLNKDTLANVRQYRQHFDVRTFWYCRPFRKAAKKSKNEFMDVWNKKIFLRTRESFPSVCRRSEVTETVEQHQNPLEVAISTVVDKNADLNRHIAVASPLEGRTAQQSFTMAINGTVDAAVNGGIANYAPFLTGSFQQDHPEIWEDVMSSLEKKAMLAKLKSVLEEHLRILKRGVILHSRVCIEAMLPLQEIIVQKFPILLHQMEELGLHVVSFTEEDLVAVADAPST